MRARRSRIACACLVAAAVVAGCGGGAATHAAKSKPKPKPHPKPATSLPAESSANRALIARADAVCQSTEAQAAAATARIKVRHDPDGPREAFIKTALATLAISDRGVAQLRALGPVGDLPPHWSELVADVAKEDSTGHALLRAAQTQNTIAAAEAQITQRNAELDLEKVSDEDRFRVCGKPANA